MKRDVVAEHAELRAALERLHLAVGTAELHADAAPDVRRFMRRKLRLEAVHAFRVLEAIAPVPGPAPRSHNRPGRPASHPLPVPGETIGARTVVAVLPPTGKRADRRIEWQCSCGERGSSLIFNFRRMSPECLHGDVREARSA